MKRQWLCRLTGVLMMGSGAVASAQMAPEPVYRGGYGNSAPRHTTRDNTPTRDRRSGLGNWGVEPGQVVYPGEAAYRDPYAYEPIDRRSSDTNHRASSDRSRSLEGYRLPPRGGEGPFTQVSSERSAYRAPSRWNRFRPAAMQSGNPLDALDRAGETLPPPGEEDLSLLPPAESVPTPRADRDPRSRLPSRRDVGDSIRDRARDAIRDDRDDFRPSRDAARDDRDGARDDRRSSSDLRSDRDRRELMDDRDFQPRREFDDRRSSDDRDDRGSMDDRRASDRAPVQRSPSDTSTDYGSTYPNSSYPSTTYPPPSYQSEPVYQPQQSYPSSSYPTNDSAAYGGYASPYESAAAAPWQGSPPVIQGPSYPAYDGGSYGGPAPYDTGSAIAGSPGCGPAMGGPAMGGPIAAGPISAGPIAGGPILGGRPNLFPWFGGGNVLFFDLADSKGRQVFHDYPLRTSAVDPHAHVGFETTVGRYLGCGRFGLSATYFFFDPESAEVIGTLGGNSNAAMPGYHDVSYNNGGGARTMHAVLQTAVAGYGGATNARLRRDVDFQGIELNLNSFGLMGANRLAYDNCCAPGFLGRCGGGRGFGGSAGPLQRPCGGRVRVTTLHGFRWFQARDDFEAAYNVNGTADYQNDDLFDRFNVENNLYGYQFGGMLTYCLGRRFNLNVGGKTGIYGNEVRAEHYVGNGLGTGAYVTTDNTNIINRHARDTSLATLSQLNLGVGFRANCALTINGGYQLMGLTGVANSVDSHPFLNDIHALHIDTDSSYILHGGYVGASLNW